MNDIMRQGGRGVIEFMTKHDKGGGGGQKWPKFA